mgnify:CR=1 FL=1
MPSPNKRPQPVTRRTAIGIIGGTALVVAALAIKRQPNAQEAQTAPASTESEKDEAQTINSSTPAGPTAIELLARLDVASDFHDELSHGPKGVEYQHYIVLHDTEGDGEPEDIVSYWVGNGNLVAAQFVVGKDGHIAQCVPVDQIAHHAGYGDAGHNELYGVTDESRDDKRGTTPVGSACPDYGMNSYSIGIEMVHVGGESDSPAEQLNALDGLIAYIDAYFAEMGQSEPSAIIDHKAWRTGNSDTSAEFAGYLANYQDHRTHLNA